MMLFTTSISSSSSYCYHVLGEEQRFSNIPLNTRFLHTSKQTTHIHKLTLLYTQISFPYCQYLLSSSFHQKIVHRPTDLKVGVKPNLRTL